MQNTIEKVVLQPLRTTSKCWMTQFLREVVLTNLFFLSAITGVDKVNLRGGVSALSASVK